jgi:hypothetical protein
MTIFGAKSRGDGNSGPSFPRFGLSPNDQRRAARRRAFCLTPARIGGRAARMALVGRPRRVDGGVEASARLDKLFSVVVHSILRSAVIQRIPQFGGGLWPTQARAVAIATGRAPRACVKFGSRVTWGL